MSINRAQLRRRAIVRASGVALDPDDWNDLCDDAIASLYRRILKVNEDFRVKSTVISVVSISSPKGSLPSDFMDLRSVCRSKGTSSEEYLSKVGPKTGSMGYMRGYRVEDNSPTSLVIEPYEMSVGDYTVVYNPQPPTLDDDKKTMDVELQQFDGYVVDHMAMNAVISDEGNEGPIGEALGIIAAEVDKWAKKGRTADPDQVEDVRRTRGRRFFLPLP